VDKRDTKVEPANVRLLIVSLHVIKAGKYRVTWRVVSVDTHVTNGSSEFEITEPRVSGESAAWQAEFAPRAHSNQRQLTGKLKATFTLEECKILGRIINRFCNFLGASSSLERRLIEKRRRLIANAKISGV